MVRIAAFLTLTVYAMQAVAKVYNICRSGAKYVAGVAVVLCGVTSCSNRLYMGIFAPEESGLNLTKITDETRSHVMGIAIIGEYTGNAPFVLAGINRQNDVSWNTVRLLSVSPNGNEIAYMAKSNGQQNIMVRSCSGSNAFTQRTFRHVGDFSWGADNNLYFIDITESQNRVCVTDAHAGPFIRQLTNNNMDFDPILSPDQKKVYFTRFENNFGPAIWSCNLEDGRLTNCAPGFHPAMLRGKEDEFYCVRNSNEGHSEIWRVNYVNGKETLILSDRARSYTHPAVSPNGEWLLVTGNSQSSINNQKNLDIFAVKTDGSSFMQLTYHPGNDCAAQWSEDGESIYFISDRATKERLFNVWKMDFKPNNRLKVRRLSN